MRAAWNRLSAAYQGRHDLPTDSAHYGPWAPPENELRILGDVQGLHILELGCGGGQCTIAFAKQGAHAAGIDLSDAQLDYARRLAKAEQVEVDFFQGTAEDLSAFATAAWDVVFSTYAFHYVENIGRCLGECARVLRPGGRLVFSLDHPFRDCFLDEEEDEVTIYPARSYFDDRPVQWVFDTTGVRLQSYHHTIAQWLELLSNAGFRLARLLEPCPPKEVLDAIWPEDDPLSPLRHVPLTIIFVAEKT